MGASGMALVDLLIGLSIRCVIQDSWKGGDQDGTVETSSISSFLKTSRGEVFKLTGLKTPSHIPRGLLFQSSVRLLWILAGRSR
jgi:hypothetical protein